MARFDQANEIENFHLSQIDFKPETTCGQRGGKKQNKKPKSIELVEHDMHFTITQTSVSQPMF